MTVERFQELAEAYGADLRRWPGDRARGRRSPSPAQPVLNGCCSRRPTDALLHAAPAVSPARRVIARRRGSGETGLGRASGLAAPAGRRRPVPA